MSASIETAPRIPHVDPESLGPQLVRAGNEGYLEHDASDQFVSPWISNYRKLTDAKKWAEAEEGSTQALVDFLGENFAIDSSNSFNFEIAEHATLLEPGHVSQEAAEIFENKWARQAFDYFLTRYTTETGGIDGLVAQSEGQLYRDDVSGFINFSDILLNPQSHPDLVLAIVETHSLALEYVEGLLEEMMPDVQGNFKHKLEQAIESGMLPQQAMDNLQNEPHKAHKAGSVSVQVIDPVIGMLEGTHGRYSAGSNAMHIDGFMVLLGEEKVKEIYNHEKFHLLSGTLVALEGDVLEDEPEDVLDDAFANATIRRVGFKHKPRSNDAVGEELNEAFTEWSALALNDQTRYLQQDLVAMYEDFGNSIEKVKGGEVGTRYLPERILLAYLVVKGVDILTIGEAYFEDYEPKIDNPDREPGSTMPANRALDTAVAEITPFKSLRQLQLHLKQEAAKLGGTQEDQRWAQIEIFKNLAAA